MKKCVQMVLRHMMTMRNNPYIHTVFSNAACRYIHLVRVAIAITKGNPQRNPRGPDVGRKQLGRQLHACQVDPHTIERKEQAPYANATPADRPQMLPSYFSTDAADTAALEDGRDAAFTL